MACLPLFTHLYLFVCKSHCGCSYFHCLSGSSLLLGDCASDGPVCALLTTSKGMCVFKKASVWSVPTVPFYFPALRLCYSAGKGKTCSRWVLLVTECLENSTCSWFFRQDFFEDGECRGEADKGMWQHSVKWDLNPCYCGYMGWELMGWRHHDSSVCFRAAAHSFCSVQIQFYRFTVFRVLLVMYLPLWAFPPLFIPAPYGRVQMVCVSFFTMAAVMAYITMNYVGI